MNLKLCSLLIIFSIFSTLDIKGVSYPDSLHHYAQRNWRSVSGLSHDNVTSIYRDRSGFVWAGTIEGITRIDGTSAKIFTTRTHPGLLNNRILKIDGSATGVIYALSSTGISRISKSGNIEKVLEETDIFDFAVASDSEIFVAKHNELLIVKGSEIKRLSVLNGMPDGTVTAVAAFNGILYFGNDSGGLFSYSQGSFSSALCEMNKDEITAVAVNEKGSVIFGTSSGNMFFADNSKCQPLNLDFVFPETESRIISVSYKKSFVRAVTETAVIFLDGGKRKIFKNCCNMPGKLSSVLLDDEDFLWLAGDKGITLYFEGTFSTLGRDDGLTSEMVYGMVEDKTGRVWAGTRGGGLFYYSDGKFNQVPENAGVPSQFIGGLLVDKKGDLWVGTSKGIVTFTPVFPLKAKSVETAKRGMIPMASVLFQDSSDRIWAGAAGGKIYLLSKNRFALVKEIGDSKDDHISAIVETEKGKILFATSKGILSLENESFKTIDSASGLPDNLVLSLYNDSSGIIFAGTMRKGLVLIMPDGRILNLDSRKGLCSDTIFSIVKDGDKTLWFTSTQGIFSLPFQDVIDTALEKDRSLRCYPFDSSDGIKRTECTGGVQPASMIRKDGSLWFPTVEGIAVSQSGIMRESNIHLSIDSVMIDGVYRNFSEKIMNSGTISLFELKFTASRFIHPERLKVRYILDGYENEWKDLNPLEKRAVTYQKVGSGSFEFKVEASGDKTDPVTGSFEVTVKSDSIFSDIDIKLILISIIFASLAYIFFINFKRRGKVVPKEMPVEKVSENIEVIEHENKVDPEIESDYEELKDDSPKYEKSRLDESVAQSYATELKTLMEQKKPYRDPDLTLPELAKKLNLSPNILSQVINSYCCQNFYNFVNTYRVEEVVSLMKDPSMKDKSILDMAYEAGFKSKTTFNTIFKKHTGLTPSELRRNIAENPSDQ